MAKILLYTESMENDRFVLHGIYKHFKGNLYLLEDVFSYFAILPEDIQHVGIFVVANQIVMHSFCHAAMSDN